MAGLESESPTQSEAFSLTGDLSRRTIVQGIGATSLAALAPSSSGPALPPAALDLEALLGDEAMANARARYQDGIFTSAASTTRIDGLFTEDGRFNLSPPIRYALAQFLSDGKDVLVPLPDDVPWRGSRDRFILRLYRNFVVLPHYYYYYYYYYGLHGELAAPPRTAAVVLTQERHFGLARDVPHCIPPFRTCQFF